MSAAFPTDKDGIIDQLCEDFGVVLEDEEYEHLRKLTRAQLYLVSIVVGRAVKRVKVEQEMSGESLVEDIRSTDVRTRIATLVAAVGLHGWLGLSRATGVSRSTIWTAINARKLPRRATVCRLATVLQVSPELLTDILRGSRDLGGA